jgi:hypothetical protein
VNSAHLGRFEGALFEGFAEEGVDGFATLGETVLAGPREADPSSLARISASEIAWAVNVPKNIHAKTQISIFMI